MNGSVRQLRIRQLIESNEFVDLDTLRRDLAASVSTLRRDLMELEQQGVLRRVYGGAMSAQPSTNGTLDYQFQSRRMESEKERMAALVAGLVEDGQTVILDGGSTVAAVSRHLAGRRLQVVTNSMAIAEVFADARQIELTLTGGYLYPRTRVMVGPLCEHTLSTVRADTLIMGTGGVTEAGYSNNNTLVVGPERKMIEVSQRVIIVADHSKFGKSAMIPVAPLDVADLVVSDSGLAAGHQQMLREHKVEVRLA
jgi:DeoR family transcriptional regulator, fructose operon transcriptional repressor